LPTLSALLGHAVILITTRHVRPAAEQKQAAIERSEKFRERGVIAAPVVEQNQKVTTAGPMNYLGTRNALKEMVDVAGIEPATPCLQSRCSPS
jgi:hypothetical protein